MTVPYDPPADGQTNMVKDLALLEAGIVAARVYSWDGPWVSLGKSQSPDADLLPSCPIPHVERPTGGHAVLHGHDATIGLAIPMQFVRRSIRATYRTATLPIIEALRGCGLNAILAADTEFVRDQRDRPDCFAAISETDIVDEATGLKICGCALRRSREAVLIQASIPNGPPLVDPARVFRDPAPNVGLEWDSRGLAKSLEEALRYNLTYVPTA